MCCEICFTLRYSAAICHLDWGYSSLDIAGYIVRTLKTKFSDTMPDVKVSTLKPDFSATMLQVCTLKQKFVDTNPDGKERTLKPNFADPFLVCKPSCKVCTLKPKFIDTMPDGKLCTLKQNFAAPMMQICTLNPKFKGTKLDGKKCTLKPNFADPLLGCKKFPFFYKVFTIKPKHLNLNL